MVALFIIGGIGLLIGIILVITNLKNLKRRKRIQATPTTPIAQAPGNGLVEVKGRVIPSEQGVLQAPFSGRPAVWAKITVQEYVQRGRSSYWKTLVTESDMRHFWIDDGSGQMARVLPQDANFNLDPTAVAGSGTFNAAQPHIEAFLTSRGLKSTNFLGLNKRMKFLEEILQPNEPVFALGPSRRDPGPPVSDGYRMVPSSQLVMFNAVQGKPGSNLDAELLISNKDEAKLLSKLLTPTIVGIVLLVLGVGFSVGGVLMAIFGDDS